MQVYRICASLPTLTTSTQRSEAKGQVIAFWFLAQSFLALNRNTCEALEAMFWNWFFLSIAQVTLTAVDLALAELG